jgi:hypothetical protein
MCTIMFLGVTLVMNCGKSIPQDRNYGQKYTLWIKTWGAYTEGMDSEPL